MVFLTKEAKSPGRGKMSNKRKFVVVGLCLVLGGIHAVYADINGIRYTILFGASMVVMTLVAIVVAVAINMCIPSKGKMFDL